MKIVLLDGCEKEYVQTEKIIQYIQTLSHQHNDQLKILTLREKRISHCTKCLVCTNKRGTDPVKCFLEDGMDDVIDMIEQADAYIVLTDRKSIFKKNKLFRKFASRLLAYYYRPNKKEPPRRRRPQSTKNAVIINYNLSTFFPGIGFSIAKYHINKSAKDIGARVKDSIMISPSNTNSIIWKTYEKKIEDLFHKLYEN